MSGPRSMEAALDEERIAILALLEGQKNKTAKGVHSRTSSPTPYGGPRSPMRSMLDVDDGASARHNSIAAATAGATGVTSRSGAIRSMLDIGGSSKSAHTSPTEANYNLQSLNSPRVRSQSDASAHAVDFVPRAPVRQDPTLGYQFSGILPSNPGGPVVPKRNTQAGRKSSAPPNAMVEAIREAGLADYVKDFRGRNAMASTNVGSHHKSRSPVNRFSSRSKSPGPSRLSAPPNVTHNQPGKYTLDDGRIVDMNSAYRRLSNANLALAGGTLSDLASRSGQRRMSSGDALSPTGGARLTKDYTFEEDEGALADSSDDYEATSDEETGRGRKAGKADTQSKTTVSMGQAQGPRKTLSLMAAAEEERTYTRIVSIGNLLKCPTGKEVSAKYKVKSLFEPEIMVTGPGGDRLKSSRPGVHPTTSFRSSASGFDDFVDSDTEAEISDIKRAQMMAINLTKIVSTPETHRSVRTLYRGDFADMQKSTGKDGKDNRDYSNEEPRRFRKYLVATDLSEEAQHALEWTVGTVLRDGDTLLAIYCVDEETGIGRDPDGLLNDADTMTLQNQASVIAASATSKPSHYHQHTHLSHLSSGISHPSPLGPGHKSATPSPIGRERSKSEEERYRAVEDITERVSRLLRKTKLQVRVVVEVIHCKSPKHLITEVIDFIDPTLVVLGSRGRSALKGYVCLFLLLFRLAHLSILLSQFPFPFRGSPWPLNLPAVSCTCTGTLSHRVPVTAENEAAG